VVVEAWRTSPKVIEPARQVQDTHIFLRMAAIELRRMAEQVPEVAAELRHVAQKLAAEAEDLVPAIADDSGSIDPQLDK
jgi:hypothetical protein